MWRNYLKISIRNILRNKATSLINIGGLSVGLAVTILIGLWMYDELTINRNFENYANISQVLQNQNFNGIKDTDNAVPIPLEKELRTTYGSYFKHIALTLWPGESILGFEDKNISAIGNYVQANFPEIISLKMIQGTRQGLNDPKSILLSESMAKALFDRENPLNQIINLGSNNSMKVIGIYQDIPKESRFGRLAFIAPWSFWAHAEWLKESSKDWDNNSYQIFVQTQPGADLAAISEEIRFLKSKNITGEDLAESEYFLHPMSKWHLYSEFKDGKIAGGRIDYVRLYGLIGIFVLFLACVNFINLNTARAERRAREVGIRKVMGSSRQQLIGQFLSESFLVVSLSFLLALLLVDLSLPFFNQIVGKEIQVLWSNPIFWLLNLTFIVFTSFVAGSYPAFYLSSFNPVKVLKGTFRAGRHASLPRKILVTIQFTVSISLIIGTIVVYNQIQYAKNRPLGYDQDNIIMINKKTRDFFGKNEVFDAELKSVRAITSLAESSGSLTNVSSTSGRFDWPGKAPNTAPELAFYFVSHDYGKTIDWEIAEGRDFSRAFSTDSNGVILNETAVKLMGLEDPIGKEITWADQEKFRVVGVVKDLIMQSPFDPIYPSIFILNYTNTYWMYLKLNPEKPLRESLSLVESVFNKIVPSAPFDYYFVDEAIERNFRTEERLGTLAGIFAGLAIFISCLGLFGLASYIAEKRSKEIVIRKVLGASVLSLWTLLSKDFIILVGISCILASPVAYFYLNSWLQNYPYHTEIAWWIFLVAGLGALMITLLTVSYQSFKAATLNPVDMLKNE